MRNTTSGLEEHSVALYDNELAQEGGGGTSTTHFGEKKRREHTTNGAPAELSHVRWRHAIRG